MTARSMHMTMAKARAKAVDTGPWPLRDGYRTAAKGGANASDHVIDWRFGWHMWHRRHRSPFAVVKGRGGEVVLSKDDTAWRFVPKRGEITTQLGKGRQL